MRIAILLLTVLTLAGCETLKPYEKEYLLSPVMDDDGITKLSANLMSSASGNFEKLAAGAPGGVGGSSCPTCGG